MKDEGKTNPAHVHDLQNARVEECPTEEALVDQWWDRLEPVEDEDGGEPIDSDWRVIRREWLCDAMRDAVLQAIANMERAPVQSEVPMEDERPLEPNVQRLIDQHEALGSHRALAQSLSVMSGVMADEGAVGHEVICRRAARFVRVMAMQVTRFLAQPDLRLCHPTVDGDLQVTACTVNDSGLVQVMCTGSDDMPAPTLPLHELVPAGPIADMSRVVGQIMARTVVQDAIGQLIKTGKMPGLDELTARHGLDFSEGPAGGQMQPGDAVTYRDVDGREYNGTVTADGSVEVSADAIPSDSAWQPDEQLRRSMPEAEQLRTIVGVDLASPGGDMTVDVEATKDADGTVHIHNLTAHAGYVLKDGAHTEPEDKP